MQIYLSEDGEPPQLQELLGLKVKRVWVLPEASSLFVLFDASLVVQFTAVPVAGPLAAVRVEAGTTTRSMQEIEEFLDARIARDPALDDLIGLPYTGMTREDAGRRAILLVAAGEQEGFRLSSPDPVCRILPRVVDCKARRYRAN